MRRRAIILGCLCLVMGLVAFVMVYSPAAHYRRHHDPESLYKVMYKTVKPGDSLDRVQKLLGSGEESEPKAREAIKRIALKLPDSYPHGVRDSDQFLKWPMGEGGAIHFQFRDGKLINHIPSHYAEYQPITSVKASSVQ